MRCLAYVAGQSWVLPATAHGFATYPDVLGDWPPGAHISRRNDGSHPQHSCRPPEQEISRCGDGRRAAVGQFRATTSAATAPIADSAAATAASCPAACRNIFRGRRSGSAINRKHCFHIDGAGPRGFAAGFPADGRAAAAADCAAAASTQFRGRFSASSGNIVASSSASNTTRLYSSRCCSSSSARLGSGCCSAVPAAAAAVAAAGFAAAGFRAAAGNSAAAGLEPAGFADRFCLAAAAVPAAAAATSFSAAAFCAAAASCASTICSTKLRACLGRLVGCWLGRGLGWWRLAGAFLLRKRKHSIFRSSSPVKTCNFVTSPGVH